MQPTTIILRRPNDFSKELEAAWSQIFTDNVKFAQSAEEVDLSAISQDGLLLIDCKKPFFFDLDLQYLFQQCKNRAAKITRYNSNQDRIEALPISFLPFELIKSAPLQNLIGLSQSFQTLLMPGFYCDQDESELLRTWQGKPKKPALFLDRDGVIIEDVGYPHRPSQLKIFPEIYEMIRLARNRGHWIIGLSNQAGIAKGLFSENDLQEFTDLLQAELAKKEANLDAIYYCPYHPQAKLSEYKKDSVQRKPGPGLLLRAAQDFRIDLTNSWMIGDKPSDVLEQLKIRTLLIKGNYELGNTQATIFPEHQGLFNFLNDAMPAMPHADTAPK